LSLPYKPCRALDVGLSFQAVKYAVSVFLPKVRFAHAFGGKSTQAGLRQPRPARESKRVKAREFGNSYRWSLEGQSVFQEPKDAPGQEDLKDQQDTRGARARSKIIQKAQQTKYDGRLNPIFRKVSFSSARLIPQFSPVRFRGGNDKSFHSPSKSVVLMG